MTAATTLVSPMSFSEAADTFGYRYTAMSTSAPVGDRTAPLFEGRLGLRSLPCGASLWSSDLRSLHDSTLESVADRSLTVAVMLGDHAADCETNSGSRLYIGGSDAAVISVADQVHLTGRYRAGQRSQCLLLRAQPEDFADAEVAEQMWSALKATAVKPLAMTHRTRLLARELAAPNTGGAVGRLLAESFALELLARALLSTSQDAESSPGRLTGRDYAKVLIVRDMIEASPSTNFTLEGLAREAGLSVSALKAKFPLAFGQSVFAFLRDVRMERARLGIEEEEWTASQAAYFVGYKHLSNFTIAFRRKFGVPPSQLRRQD